MRWLACVLAALPALLSLLAQPASATLTQYRIEGVVSFLGPANLTPEGVELGTPVAVDFVYNRGALAQGFFPERIEYPAVESVSVRVGNYQSGELALRGSTFFVCPDPAAIPCTDLGLVEGYTIIGAPSGAAPLDGEPLNIVMLSLPSPGALEDTALPLVLPPATDLGFAFGPSGGSSVFFAFGAVATSGPFVVPEPSTALCLLLGLSLLRRRRTC